MERHPTHSPLYFHPCLGTLVPVLVLRRLLPQTTTQSDEVVSETQNDLYKGFYSETTFLIYRQTRAVSPILLSDTGGDSTRQTVLSNSAALFNDHGRLGINAKISKPTTTLRD